MAKDKQDASVPRARGDEPVEPPAAPASPRERRRTVRAWTADLKVRRALVAGAARLAGWTPETELTEPEFQRGLDAYTQRPLGGSARTSSPKVRLAPGGSR